MAEPMLIALHKTTECHMLPALANRHGLITGATGKQGGATIRSLQGKNFNLRAMTRHPGGEAARVLAVEEFRPEVILVATSQAEAELALVTSCPIVIDHLGERRALRTRLRLAAALHAVRQVKGGP